MQRRRRAAKGVWPVMIWRCPMKAGDGKLSVRASATILFVRKGTSLRNPARTSSRTKYKRISIWRENFRRTGFSLIATQARLSSYKRVAWVCFEASTEQLHLHVSQRWWWDESHNQYSLLWWPMVPLNVEHELTRQRKWDKQETQEYMRHFNALKLDKLTSVPPLALIAATGNARGKKNLQMFG